MPDTVKEMKLLGTTVADKLKWDKKTKIIVGVRALTFKIDLCHKTQ